MKSNKKLTDTSKIFIGWAFAISGGLYAFVLSKRYIISRRYETMKSRERMRSESDIDLQTIKPEKKLSWWSN